MLLSRLSRGFSLAELVVVLLISAIFGAMVVQAIDSTTASARNTLARAETQANSRDLVNELTRSLRSARILGTCRDPKSGSTACLPISESSAFAYGSGSCAIFYAYSTDSLADGERDDRDLLRTPDLVVARLTDDTGALVTGSGAPGTLRVERFAPISPNIAVGNQELLLVTPGSTPELCVRRDGDPLTQAAGWTGQPFRVSFINDVRVGGTPPLLGQPAGLFTFLNSKAAPVLWDANTPQTNASIVLIALNAQFDNPRGRVTDALDVNLVVDLPAAAYLESLR